MEEKVITAQELFFRVLEFLQTPDLKPEVRNKMMHDTLVLCCHEGIRDTEQSFGNLFSQVDFLCKIHGVSIPDKIAIQAMRRHSNSTEALSKEELLYDARALSIFISAVFSESIPSFLVGVIPTENRPHEKGKKIDYGYIRCIVQNWDDDYIYATIDQDAEEQQITICLKDEEAKIDHSYLKDLIKIGMQVNLLDCYLQTSSPSGRLGGVLPRLIILEPDYLIDISQIAACFTEYGHHPLLYLLNMMKPRANTQATLFGNFAGSALDDIVNSRENYQVNTTVKSNFKEKALEFCTCPNFDPKKFFFDANTQANNLEQVVKVLFDKYDREKAILEPSFVCESLGIQGRVDLMTTDMKLLVEQKSGRNLNVESRHPDPSYHSYQLENHYVQLLLYYGVLHYNFDLNNNRVDIRLLYSKYPPKDGLMVVAYYQALFREALRYRNELVAAQFDIAHEGFDSCIEEFTPDNLNVAGNSEFFYKKYLKPQLEELTNPLHQLNDVERAYYSRMMTFVLREQMISKVGALEGTNHSTSDLWNMPVAEKRDAGNIYTDLHIVKKEKSNEFNGYDTITFSVPDQGEDFLPNFRIGDGVYLYSYVEKPDIRRSILFKGILQEIHSDSLIIHLMDGQQNPDIFNASVVNARKEDCENPKWAIEHSLSDSAGSSIRSLHQFISADQSVRDLLLGQRAPRKDESLQLSRSYDKLLDPIILKAKQAKDYFLLVGPPGTGKTSRALQFLVREVASLPSLPFRERAVGRVAAAHPDIYEILKNNSLSHRKEATESEEILWNYLRANNLGVHFRRQHAIDDFIVDFVCLEIGLVIEVDGGYHSQPEQQAADNLRTEILEEKGYLVIRFTNEQVGFETDKVISEIKSKIEALSLKGRAGREAGCSVLLLSYTNRAVDEICEMLCDNGISFLRIGNEFSCDERFRPYLIDKVIEQYPKMVSVQQLIKDTQIIVGTTSMIASKSYIFNLKHFDLAIIDEASQILEPNLVGLLSMLKGNSPLPEGESGERGPKFILIGDYKQLPAVVQQSEEDSKVVDPILNDICLDNCRNSLFERLIRWEYKNGREDFIGILRRQGRMHPDIAEFPNSHFYYRENLECVPLEHQLDNSIAHRMIFIPSKFCKQPNISDKVNIEEARIVSRLLYKVYKEHQQEFDVSKTVGVIVPYRNQIAMIRKEIEKLQIPVLEKITIDTVERYQGSQRDFIIYSFTIQNYWQLEFLTANSFVEDGHIIDRKLNVAITRARKQMIMTGNPRILSSNVIFRELIDYCKGKGGYLEQF